MWTQYSIKSYFSFLEYYFCIFNSDVLLKYYSGLLLFALSLILNFINLKVAINSLLVTTKFHCGDYTSIQWDNFFSAMGNFLCSLGFGSLCSGPLAGVLCLLPPIQFSKVPPSFWIKILFGTLWGLSSVFTWGLPISGHQR